jgi:hypothetical protein
VNAQRSTDGIAVPAGLQYIVLGKDFDSFMPSLLYRDTQLMGNPANVEPDIPGWERSRHEHPEMSTAMAVLKRRRHTVLLEINAEPEEVRERILVIRVNGHPLRALGGGVYGVETDGDFPFKVATDCVGCQAEPLAGSTVFGPIVIMAAAFWMGSIRLEGVRTPVDEEVEVIRRHARRCSEMKLSHSFLPEVRWTAPLLLIGGETIGD